MSLTSGDQDNIPRLAGMPTVGQKQLACHRLPDLHRAIQGAGGEVAVVGRPRHGPHFILMTAIGERGCTRQDVLDVHGPIRAR